MNTKVMLEQDEVTGEWDSVTSVISGGRIYHMPTEWINPDAEYVTTSDSRDDDRDAQYEPEQTWINYDDVKVTDTADPSVLKIETQYDTDWFEDDSEEGGYWMPVNEYTTTVQDIEATRANLKDTAEPEALKFDRKVLCSSTFHNESMECYRCKCSITLDAYVVIPYSVEYAQQSMVIDSMVHWYAHKPAGITRKAAEAKRKADDTKAAWLAKHEGASVRGIEFR